MFVLKSSKEVRALHRTADLYAYLTRQKTNFAVYHLPSMLREKGSGVTSRGQLFLCFAAHSVGTVEGRECILAVLIAQGPQESAHADEC